MKVPTYFIVKNIFGLSFTLRFFTLVAARSKNGIEPYTSFTVVQMYNCISNVLLKEIFIRVNYFETPKGLSVTKAF